MVPIGVVKEYISSQLPLAEELIDSRARGVFSEWLVAARKASPRIGRRAIAAAWAEHLEAERRWQQQLSAVRAVVAGEDPGASALGGFSLRPLEGAGDDPSGPSADVLDGFDLTPVYTASHVFETLGRGNAFWAYYCEERGKQLSIALASRDAGGDAFMTRYQEYLSQARRRGLGARREARGAWACVAGELRICFRRPGNRRLRGSLLWRTGWRARAERSSTARRAQAGLLNNES